MVIVAGVVSAIAILAGAFAEQSNAVHGKYKTTLTLSVLSGAPILESHSGFFTVDATGLIKSKQKLCRSNRNVELWSRKPSGQVEGNVGNSDLAPKGAFRVHREVRFGYESDQYMPGSTVEFWAVVPSQVEQRFRGGYLLLCKRAVSPHVSVQVPYVAPPPLD